MFTDRWVLLACATVMFLLGLVMCTNGGMYVLQLIDTYAATFSALIIGMAEVCVISWHYGIDRFLDDIKMMLGHDAPPRWYWRFVWKFFTPIIIVVSYFWNWFIAINLLIIGTFTFRPSWFLHWSTSKRLLTAIIHILWKLLYWDFSLPYRLWQWFPSWRPTRFSNSTVPLQRYI